VLDDLLDRPAAREEVIAYGVDRPEWPQDVTERTFAGDIMPE
jgi:hypothetical protein